MRPYFLTLGVSILLATLSTTNIAVAKKPFPSKLYKIHITECYEHLDRNLKNAFLEGPCKEKFDRGIYVWGKPKSIGIIYYEATYAGTARGYVDRDWLLAGKNKPRNPTQAHTDIFVESEGCDVYPTSTKRNGFYPVHQSIKMGGSMAAASSRRVKIFFGSVEEASENETQIFKKYIQNDFNPKLFNNDDRFKFYSSYRPAQLIGLQRLCASASNININPQQVIPITGTATNENPLEIMYDEKILESFEKRQ